MHAVVLSSGGVDSTTCLALAVAELGAAKVVTVSIAYGQRHRRELAAARKIADYYGVRHYEFDLSALFRFSDSAMLADSPTDVPHSGYAEQTAASANGKVATYVPFRNGLMLAAATTLAGSLFSGEEAAVYIGAHADDAAGNAYADCSQPFLASMGEAISCGTYNEVKLIAPFAGKNKAEVVKTGLGLKVPYELTWSCYENGQKPCGECATCRDRTEAFRLNGVTDPLLLQ